MPQTAGDECEVEWTSRFTTPDEVPCTWTDFQHLSGVFALQGENTRQLHKLRGGFFKLVSACGSMVLTIFCFSFSRSQSAKTKNDRKKMYRSAEGYDCIRYATA
jgi:hypothetical protein